MTSGTAGDRSMLARVVAGALGLGLAVNALVMLADPALWYQRLPGVSASGPLNVHFVRDIGCANLVVGIAFLGRALARPVRWSAVTMAAVLLCVHAILHVWELLGAPRDAGHRFARDLAPVYLPAALAAWLALDAARRDRSAARPRGARVR
jgi:hypothetical protein